MIQTQYRKYRACVRVRLIRYSLNKIYAATKINSIVRMYQAVQRVRSLVYSLLLKKCSIMIQSVARGFIGRRFVIKKILDLERFHAAKFIQKHIRGKIARLRLVGVRKAVNLYWNKQKISAITIQKLYRGFRGRIKTRSIVLEFKRKRKLLYDSATLIINMCRCFVAVSKSKRYVKERLDGWIDTARGWKETWSEESQCWFYLKAETGKIICCICYLFHLSVYLLLICLFIYLFIYFYFICNNPFINLSLFIFFLFI